MGTPFKEGNLKLLSSNLSFSLSKCPFKNLCTLWQSELLLLDVHPLFCSFEQANFTLPAFAHTIAFINDMKTRQIYTVLALFVRKKSSQHYSTVKLLHRAEDGNIQVKSWPPPCTLYTSLCSAKGRGPLIFELLCSVESLIDS